jgi:hypothetical protein
MAIVFDCPHCKEKYRLKDEFGGKTATCKNPNCRKVIPIPKPKDPVPASKKVDVDALAAAMFSEEAVVAEKVEEATIQVTCTGCDHVWMVEASKEGKNVLCPECRKPNRVPPRKKEEKADWRTGSGRPTLAKVETGLDVQGAFATTNVGSIGQATAREIVRDRDSKEEPEVIRKRWIKRGIWGFVVLLAIGGAGYYVVKQRGVAQAEGKMEDAVAEVQGAAKGSVHHALILRASGEHRCRTATNEEEIKQALTELRLAKNMLGNQPPGADTQGSLAEIAITMVDLLGSAQEVSDGKKLNDTKVIGEIRTTLTSNLDNDLLADAIRVITRKCAEKEQPEVALGIARQLSNELLGQAGLELLRIDSSKYQDEVQKLLASVAFSASGDATSMKTLRLVMPKSADKKDEDQPTFSYISSAEEKAIRGQIAEAAKGLGQARPDERVRALTAAAQAVIDKQPAEAATLLEAAAKEAREAKAYNSPWMAVRICRLLAKAGRFDSAETLAASMSDSQAQSWARLEILRGRLASAKGQKAEDAWLDSLGDATKLAAAAKAREEMARHNAAGGHSYPAMTTWEKGKVKPFGIAGNVLGIGDR